MALYRVCGVTLRSSVPIPELAHSIEHGVGREPDFTFGIACASALTPRPSRWQRHFCDPGGRSWLSVAKGRSGYVLRFRDLATFSFSADAMDIRCYPVPGTPLETIRHLLLDQVIPMALSRSGRLVLHAAAVVTPAGAVAFLGPSGRGKSTLTASFAQDGFPLLADDALLLEETRRQFVAVPSYSGLRLWPDSVSGLYGEELELPYVAHYADKRRIGPYNGGVPFCSEPVPLRRMYLLADPDETGDTNVISIAPLAPRDAFVELVKNSYHLDIADQAALRVTFDAVGRLIAALPLCLLSFPRELSRLPTVREAIRADIERVPCVLRPVS